MRYKIVIFGNKATTKQFIEHIHHELIPIDLVVTVDTAKYEQSISGFDNIAEFAKELRIKSFVVSDYALTSLECQEFFTSNEFELGICIGWQRLIPQDILDRFQTGIFGFHGSAGHLPFGRGRSPQNWSLIKGHKRFLNNLFKYNKDADKGNIHSTQAFEINEFDTIQTLQYKTVLVGRNQLADLIHDYQKGSVNLIPQSSNISTWYPKRRPEDGKISILSSTSEIYNLIRGVTHPFPGAYLYSVDNNKLVIWEAFPFDSFIDTSKYKVGEVIESFGSNFILKTVDGSLLIKNYEFVGIIKKKDLFH